MEQTIGIIMAGLLFSAMGITLIYELIEWLRGPSQNEKLLKKLKDLDKKK